MRRFRNVWKWLVPGWLQRGEGALVQWVQGAIHDAYAERCRQTVWLSLPSLCASDGLDAMGRDRLLPRGLFEPVDQYRARLAAWRYPRGHRVRGSALALLEQVSIALRGTLHQSIDARGTSYTYGSTARTLGVTWDWDGSATLPSWGRYWLIVKSIGSPWPTLGDGGWGPAVLGDESVCLAGENIHRGELAAVITLASNARFGWTPAGRRGIYLVLYFDGDPFPAPTGDWDDWASRDPAYRYVPLNRHES